MELRIVVCGAAQLLELNGFKTVRLLKEYSNYIKSEHTWKVWLHKNFFLMLRSSDSNSRSVSVVHILICSRNKINKDEEISKSDKLIFGINICWQA